jgi:hypothetical protein
MDTEKPGKAGEPQDDGRRQGKDRRKKRFWPYLGKNRRKATVVREADVIEIPIPALTSDEDRRSGKTRRTKPR